jgi:hypothetical protein
VVEQHGDHLYLFFRYLQKPDDPTSITLFAEAKIDVTKKNPQTNSKFSLEYFVENVVDSSRYFVIRIIDEKSGREARIGFGFRDREEATDFRESLNYYVRSVKRKEEAAEVMHHADDLGSNLSLQEGEKIHINLGSKKKSTIITKDDKEKKKSPDGSTSSPKKTPLLLKKPPPAPKLNPDVSISFGDLDLGSDDLSGRGDTSSAAVGDLSTADDDDDEWNDFEDAGGEPKKDKEN